MNKQEAVKLINDSLERFGVLNELHLLLRKDITFEQYSKEFAELIDKAKKEYKKLAIKYHPDKTGGDDTEIKKINAYYDIVCNLEPVYSPPPPPPPVVFVNCIIIQNQTSAATTYY